MTAERLEASVIVALNPHSNDAKEVFDAYLQQTMPPESFEVIIVDGGACGGVGSAFAEHIQACPAAPVRLIASARPGRAASNNAGVRAARSDLLVFVADDFIPTPTLVRAHVEFHRHLQSPAVGIGPAFFREALRADPFCRWLEDSGRLFGVPFRIAEQSWPRDFFYVGNASVLRRLFDRVGQFDEVFQHDLFDDFEFSVRLSATGARTHYLPKAVAWHDHPVTLAERARAMRRCGVAALHCEARHVAIRPWAEAVARPVSEYMAVIRRAEEADRRGSTSATRSELYLALMDLAFTEGYHIAANASLQGTGWPERLPTRIG
jgi:GT2 family glycosyltransferase